MDVYGCSLLAYRLLQGHAGYNSMSLGKESSGLAPSYGKEWSPSALVLVHVHHEANKIYFPIRTLLSYFVLE